MSQGHRELLVMKYPD